MLSLLFMLTASMQANPAAAPKSPMSDYLDCIELEAATGRESAKASATASAIEQRCEGVLPQAAVSFAAMIAETDNGIQYRAEYLQKNGRDPYLADLLLPSVRQLGISVATQLLAGKSKADLDLRANFTLPKP